MKEPQRKDEGNTRPVPENFVVAWLMQDVKAKIDPNFVGCLKGNSTALCVLDMVNTWLSYLDSPGRHLRLFFWISPKLLIALGTIN